MKRNAVRDLGQLSMLQPVRSRRWFSRRYVAAYEEALAVSVWP